MTPGAGSLLVVEDDEMIREMLARRLRRQGYEVSVAPSGERALAMVRERPFDLVLLDVVMSGLSGLEVLSTLRQAHPATDLPVIMATARNRGTDVVEALRLGANDYVTKPVDFPVALARIRTQLSLKRAVEQVRRLNDRMARDLGAAARVHEALLPHGSPGVPGLEAAWVFRPCEELAGDFLGIVPLDATQVALYVLDVSGHGVASALLSFSAARVLSPPRDPASILVDRGAGSDSPHPVPPAQVADRLNLLFPFDLTTEQFFTLSYGVLDAATGEYRYTSAGHPGPIHAPACGRPALLEGRGFPVGLAPAGPDIYEEHRLVLAPGDRLFLYSDGVIEALGPGDETFGVERLLEAIARIRAQSLPLGVAALWEEVERWSGAVGLRDDVSILAVELAGPEIVDRTRDAGSEGAPTPTWRRGDPAAPGGAERGDR